MRKQLKKIYANIITFRKYDRLVCSFMKNNLQECEMTVIVENTPPLCSLNYCCSDTIREFKDIRVPFPKILEPKNGLAYISQLLEAVHITKCQVPSTKARIIIRMVEELQEVEFENSKQTQKIQFLSHQLNLWCKKCYSTQDFCFAVESFPHWFYDFLRDNSLVLSNEIKKSCYHFFCVNFKKILHKTFQKVNRPQQKM